MKWKIVPVFIFFFFSFTANAQEVFTANPPDSTEASGTIALSLTEHRNQELGTGGFISDETPAPLFAIRIQRELEQSLEEPDLLMPDSASSASTRRLMPANVSILENGLWGESGFFREIGVAAPLTRQSRSSELDLRRGMLYMHQVGGFVTLGLMVSAVYAGQKIVNGNPGYRPYHQAFVTGTIISYSTTALLALLSPPPLIRRDEFSTTTVHKTLAWVHAAGMIVTPILGSMIGRRKTNLQREHIHEISGYITTATFAAALISVTF